MRAPSFSTARSSISAGAETVVGRKAVVPCRATIWLIALRDSQVPSITSTPPQPWIWGSMKPGVTMNCEASIVSAPAGIRTASAGPASATESPSMIKRPGDTRLAGVRSVPASIAITLLTAASEMCQDPAKMTARFRKPLLRFLPAASGSAHDDRHLQRAAGFFDEFRRLFGFHCEDLLENILPALPQFSIRHADVDHPVAVGH